jgi:hypothetical protein
MHQFPLIFHLPPTRAREKNIKIITAPTLIESMVKYELKRAEEMEKEEEDNYAWLLPSSFTSSCS